MGERTSIALCDNASQTIVEIETQTVEPVSDKIVQTVCEFGMQTVVEQVTQTSFSQPTLPENSEHTGLFDGSELHMKQYSSVLPCQSCALILQNIIDKDQSTKDQEKHEKK